MENESARSKERLIEVVSKLTALAHDEGATDGEKSVAAEKAAEMMAKYSITDYDVGAFNGEADLDLTQIDVDGLTGRHRNWESTLAAVIAKVFDSKIVLTTWTEPWTASFIGFTSDVEVSIHFYMRLRRAVTRYSKLEYPGAQLRNRNVFAYGMVRRLGERLNEAFAKREDFIPVDSRDLIIVKGERVQDFMDELFPNTRKSPKTKLKGSRDAYFKGEKAADKVTLHTPVEAGNGDRRELSTKH
ncbi:MAG: DUF7168 domain-containing protein [Candidatus Thorarchaeota archaeon]